MFIVGWTNISRIWRKNVKGMNHSQVGSYLIFRYDTTWMDKQAAG